MARVIAGDVRIGDELQVGHEWRRVVDRTQHGTIVEITCDAPCGDGPLAYERREPVVVRWPGPRTPTAMARDQRRHRSAVG
jgi:hypothetical protein